MSNSIRGFGVAGALDHDIIRAIAPAIESMGYRTFWANDTPGGDGLAALAAAAGVVGTMAFGVGVIAVDRVPASAIIARVLELGLPTHRTVIGIGAGGQKIGSLALVAEAAKALNQAGLRVVIGALGPRMVALGGSGADGVLLNWLTPGAAARSVDILREEASGKRVTAYGYVRVGFGSGSTERLEEESIRYESFPQYAAHFERMGVRAIDTCVFGPTSAALQAGLVSFDDVVDETVVRAITGQESAEAYLALANAAAPGVR